MGARERKGKYGCSAIPSFAGACPGEASSRWSAWDFWRMGRGVKVAVVLGWSCSVTCLGVWLSPG